MLNTKLVHRFCFLLKFTAEQTSLLFYRDSKGSLFLVGEKLPGKLCIPGGLPIKKKLRSSVSDRGTQFFFNLFFCFL